MVELKKKGGNVTFTPVSTGATLSGVMGVTVLNGTNVYPAQNVTPSNLTVTPSYS